MDGYSNYNQNQPRVIYDDPNTRPMTLKDWIITLLLQMIPCVNIIMLFVWAFGNGNVNRKRYCQAILIFTAVLFVLLIIITAISGAALVGLYRQFMENIGSSNL